MRDLKVYLLKEDWRQSLYSSYYIVGFTTNKDFAEEWVKQKEDVDRVFEELKEILE